MGGAPAPSLLPSLWRLVFAVHRPRSWMERRQLRFREAFFFVLGVLLCLAVQVTLGRLGLCPKR
jgi:hypothetical protein